MSWNSLEFTNHQTFGVSELKKSIYSKSIHLEISAERMFLSDTRKTQVNSYYVNNKCNF